MARCCLIALLGPAFTIGSEEGEVAGARFFPDGWWPGRSGCDAAFIAWATAAIG